MRLNFDGTSHLSFFLQRLQADADQRRVQDLWGRQPRRGLVRRPRQLEPGPLQEAQERGVVVWDGESKIVEVVTRRMMCPTFRDSFFFWWMRFQFLRMQFVSTWIKLNWIELTICTIHKSQPIFFSPILKISKFFRGPPRRGRTSRLWRWTCRPWPLSPGSSSCRGTSPSCQLPSTIAQSFLRWPCRWNTC